MNISGGGRPYAHAGRCASWNGGPCSCPYGAETGDPGVRAKYPLDARVEVRIPGFDARVGRVDLYSLQPDGRVFTWVVYEDGTESSCDEAYVHIVEEA